MNNKIISLRMERQHFVKKANLDEYLKLYSDTQPGQNVYWNGFGDPPSISFRADFDDIEFNRQRQYERKLLKARFQGGNLAWVTEEDFELYACLYVKPIKNLTEMQESILNLIVREGPMNIALIKEITGLLVKEITPVLHKLQQAFLIYEDQFDGQWDRAWYEFNEMFPNIDLNRYTKNQALKILIPRFAYRNVIVNTLMIKSFFKLPLKDINTALSELVEEKVLTKYENDFILSSDLTLLENYEVKDLNFVYALHRNDFLYKSNEHILKDKFAYLIKDLEYDHDSLQYLLIDGEFRGVVVGHFRNGPYDLNDVVSDLKNPNERKKEILKAISDVNYGKYPERFMGENILF
ncbi:MAG: hypothetical protein R3Y35_13205 [Clostridia bacterium]